MVPSRPLLYLTLPSLALILGLVWLKRKKSSVDCDTGGKSANNNSLKSIVKSSEEEVAAVKNSTSTPTESESDNSNCTDIVYHSKSVPILSSNNNNNNLDNNTKSVGKSLPIDIAPNPRSPPTKLTEQQIDIEILKLKIHDSDYKNLRSIQELEDFQESVSPVALPGSFGRKKFSFVESAEPESIPVIVKANMNAKISPKSSFAESKCNNNKEIALKLIVDSINESSEDKIAFLSQEERDSANHSPADNNSSSLSSNDGEQEQSQQQQQEQQLQEEQSQIDQSNQLNNNENTTSTRNPPVASPPLSLCSIQSADSGKGSSPPHSEGAPATIFEFILPQTLVGRLIGTRGSYVHQIKANTGASVFIKKHPESYKTKICAVEGTQAEVDAGLRMIRDRLPLKRFPNLTMQRVCFAPTRGVIPVDTVCLNLQLIEGINNDVAVSTVISGGQVFVQQPLHPSYPSLNTLQNYMNQSYSMIETPILPEIKEDSICVVPIQGNWYRVQIVSHNPQLQSCVVKYLDFGGYVSVSTNDLRQIRTDFMAVPFQANECLLSNVKPIGDNDWSAEACDVLYNLTHGLILQAQVAGYTSDGLPEIYLYACISKDNVIFINQELVARGLAEWVDNPQVCS